MTHVKQRTIRHRRNSRERVFIDRLLAMLSADPRRPKVRGDCERSARPCPWLCCRYHLVDAYAIGAPMPSDTCALDVAVRGPLTCEEVGVLLDLNKHAVNLIEHAALRRAADMLED